MPEQIVKKKIYFFLLACVFVVLLGILGCQYWIIRSQGYEIISLRNESISNRSDAEDMRRKLIGLNPYAELPSKERVRFELIEEEVFPFGNDERILNIYTGDHLSLSYIIEGDIVGFMKYIGEENGTSFRADFVHYKDVESFDYHDYLLDIKGDGDRRYLILASLCVGTAAIMHGYLLDAKDDFSIVGKIPVREFITYPKHNPDLVFDYEDRIGNYGWDNGFIRITMKIQKGKFPVYIQQEKEEFSLKKYEDELKKEHFWIEAEREIVFDKLCCDLFTRGELFYLDQYAHQLGFTDEEVKEWKKCYMSLIKSSELYDYIEQYVSKGY